MEKSEEDSATNNIELSVGLIALLIVIVGVLCLVFLVPPVLWVIGWFGQAIVSPWFHYWIIVR